MHTTLKQVGLKPRATADVAGKLHKHATVYARRIMQSKWSQEFVLKRGTGSEQVRVILCYHGEGTEGRSLGSVGPPPYPKSTA
jgi:hypothetical protein